MNNCTARGQISLLYDMLVKNHKDSTEHKITQWINDLQEGISKGEWTEICSRAQLLTIKTYLKLIQYNWIMRISVTADRLNKMNPNIPDICVKCNSEKGTLYHCLWNCPEIQKF